MSAGNQPVQFESEQVQNALKILQEAIGYCIEQKVSRALNLLYAPDGTFEEVLSDESLTFKTRNYLFKLRLALVG